MRTKTLLTLSVTLVVFLIAPPVGAYTWEGMLKLGGIYVDEEGDFSAVQETYNIHDGFSVSQIRLAGSPSSNDYLMLNLREINLDGRRGDFLYRRPGAFKLTASYDQHRQVFDADRGVTSERKDLNLGARITPMDWLRLSGSLNIMNRDGDRLSFPEGPTSVQGMPTASVLGTGYDYQMRTGKVSAEVRKDRRGAAVDFRATEFLDDLNPDADRTGRVVSARVFTPGPLFPDKVTHLLRGAFGQRNLDSNETDYTLSNFQYTGVLRLIQELQLKYRFDAQRVDHETTGLKTDRFQHSGDAAYFFEDGSVYGGYSYETNDDDQHLTSYTSWRAGATLRGDKHKMRLRYAGREKKDTEELTLLKDVEASRFLADLEVKPTEDIALGLGYNVRDREFPDIGVKSRGEVVRANAAYTYPGWGRLSGAYAYTQDEYTDLAAGYDINSNTVTARADFERIKDTRLSGGVTWLDVGKDLDIEKSIVFLEAAYTVAQDYHFEVKYNVYNYDDFILLDRYYTANVVWFNVAYDLHVE